MDRLGAILGVADQCSQQVAGVTTEGYTRFCGLIICERPRLYD